MLIGSKVFQGISPNSSTSGTGYMVAGGENTNLVVDKENLDSKYDEDTGLPVMRIDIFYT